MVFEKDYIKRLIESMGDFFRRLGDKMDDAEYDRLLDKRCREDCGLSLREAEALTNESLALMERQESLLSLAEILRFRAEHSVHTAAEKEALREKALSLLLLLSADDNVCEAMADTAYGLMRQVMDCLTAEQMLACASFFRAGSRFDLMDNAVFFLWDTLPREGRDAARERVCAMYRDVLRLTDSDLASGGLTRQEAEDSLCAVTRAI